MCSSDLANRRNLTMDFGTNRWRLYAALAGLGLAGIGCSADNKPQPPAVNSRVQLLAFTGTNACQDLEQYIEDTAVRDMRNTLESYRDETYSWGRGGPFFGEDAPALPLLRRRVPPRTRPLTTPPPTPKCQASTKPTS